MEMWLASELDIFACLDPNSAAASREHYEKPWLTHQRRMKPRRSAEGLDASGTKSGGWKARKKSAVKISMMEFYILSGVCQEFNLSLMTNTTMINIQNKMQIM